MAQNLKVRRHLLPKTKRKVKIKKKKKKKIPNRKLCS